MDKFPEVFRRFEKQVDLTDKKQVRDSNDVIRKFEYWQDRRTSAKQKEALRRMSDEMGLPVRRIKPRTQEQREAKRKHYTPVTSKKTGKTRIVARIPKGQKGAGRFAKKR